MEVYVYIYTNISECGDKGMSYIGISTDPEKRCIGHLRANSLIGNKLRKYSSWDFDILDVAESYDEAYGLEKFYIERLDTLVPNGYNLTEGGEGRVGYECSEETKAKIRKAKIGKKRSPETIEKMKKAGKEAQNRPDVKEKKSSAQKKAFSKPEVQERHRKACKEAQNRPEVREKKRKNTKIIMNKLEVKKKHRKACKEAMNKSEVREKLRNAKLGKKRPRKAVEKQQVTRRINRAVRELEKMDQECFPLVGGLV